MLKGFAARLDAPIRPSWAGWEVSGVRGRVWVGGGIRGTRTMLWRPDGTRHTAEGWLSVDEALAWLESD